MIYSTITRLLEYALEKGLIEPSERIWAQNAILEALELDGFMSDELEGENGGGGGGESKAGDKVRNGEELILHQLLDELLSNAVCRGVISDTVTERDILDSKLMGCLTPRPAQVISRFNSEYSKGPQKATDWYYRFSQDTNYIRRDRILKDMKWAVETKYGSIDITINLSKPEKDPRAIAAARDAVSGS